MAIPAVAVRLATKPAWPTCVDRVSQPSVRSAPIMPARRVAQDGDE
ncbi:hypothetical protein [Nocardioides campestrisoli]|nr:hypothetical protein [Nocardioides campestrisoli]